MKSKLSAVLAVSFCALALSVGAAKADLFDLSIVGAGLPGLILAGGGLLVLARRRRKTA